MVVASQVTTALSFDFVATLFSQCACELAIANQLLNELIELANTKQLHGYAISVIGILMKCHIMVYSMLFSIVDGIW